MGRMSEIPEWIERWIENELPWLLTPQAEASDPSLIRFLRSRVRQCRVRRDAAGEDDPECAAWIAFAREVEICNAGWSLLNGFAAEDPQVLRWMLAAGRLEFFWSAANPIRFFRSFLPALRKGSLNWPAYIGALTSHPEPHAREMGAFAEAILRGADPFLRGPGP